MRLIVATSLAALTFGPSADAVRGQLIGSPPAVGIVIGTLDNDEAHIQSYGASFDGTSRFEIGSITKTFTATLLADMIVRHEVAADDPIERYLPEGAKAPTFEGQHITLAELATQSSGLPRLPGNMSPANVSDPYADYGERQLLAFLASYRLTRAPGKVFEYSNLGFGLLGYLLGRRLGTDYATAIRSRILEPLSMEHTSVESPGDAAHTVPGFDADGDPSANWHQTVMAGAGAIVSTPGDMLRYARASLDTSTGPLAAAMRLAQTSQREADGGRQIGYAWIVQPNGIRWHNGGTGGFRSFLGIDRSAHRAIVVLANEFIDGVDALGLHALDATVALPPAAVQDVVVDPPTLARYVGRYRFKDGSIGTVSQDARGLILTFDQPSFHTRLHARGSTDFAVRVPADFDVHFGGSGAERTMTVTQPGQPPDVGSLTLTQQQ